MNLKENYNPYFIKAFTGTLVTVFAIICIFCNPVTAGEITIDPLEDGLIWNEELVVTGTAPPGEEFVIENYLRTGYCEDADNENIDPDTAVGLKGRGILTIWAEDDSTWWFKAGLNDLAPGDYTFAAWVQGDEENRIVKNVRVTYSSPDITMIEIFEPGDSGAEMEAEPSEEYGYYSQNSYTTPGSGMDLFIIPLLSSTGGAIPKGEFLMINGKGVPGEDVLVWICKKGVGGSEIYNKAVILETGNDGKINSDNELLSVNETRELLSGQYSIFAVSGTGDELSAIKDILKNSLLPGDYLRANEESNPYQQFILLLEEPWIEFSGDEDGSVSDAIYGSVVNFTGTTNLKAGTNLVLRIEPVVPSDSREFAARITGIHVNDGDPRTWSVNYHTASEGTGEFIATILDPEGLAEGVTRINIYDPAYSAEELEDDSLLVRSFMIDPETRDITDEKAPSGIDNVKNCVLAFEAGLLLVIIAIAAVIYRKK